MIPQITGKREMHEKKIVLPKLLTVSSDFDENALQVFRERAAVKGIEVILTENGFLRIEREDTLAKEGYLLSVQEEEIRVAASSQEGVIRALTTLIKMTDNEKRVQSCCMADAPKAAHRGLHLDVARHFFDAKEVKRIIEQLSLAKMNVFHWHLADDQGWRIESKKYPKLQECSGQYYTQEEIKEVVAFAAARGIEVIPEIDMPGHTRAVLAAYPQYSCSGRNVRLARAGGIYRVILCAGADSTYDFIEDLLDEICPLFPSERFHIGGDEAPKVEWQSCPVCAAKMAEQKLTRYEDLQGYFSVRIADILGKHGKRPILWNDSLDSTLRPDNMQMQYWSVTYNKPSAEYIAQGGQWIYSDMFELYLDYPHAMTSVKKIYDNRIDLGSCEYDPANAPYGYEACVWTEHITTNEELEKRIFPRIYALAELAWHGAGDYEEFEMRLKQEMAETKKAGISVVPYDGWNPEGGRRQKEAFDYMGAMHVDLPEEDQDEVVDPSGVGEDFRRKFMSRFFKEEDIPGILNKGAQE